MGFKRSLVVVVLVGSVALTGMCFWSGGGGASCLQLSVQLLGLLRWLVHIS